MEAWMVSGLSMLTCEASSYVRFSRCWRSHILAGSAIQCAVSC